MKPIVIGKKEFADKVLGCWLGKNLGGTLGAPHEGKRYMLALDFYDPVPKTAAANDDLDLQLVWLKLLEDCGLDPALPQFAEYWSKYACSYPWDEYGFFMRNYTRGLRPPVAGCFENYFVDNMGSPIRSEIWAVLHAGNPQAAARMAWKDSALDHAGGEGTCGEMFWAAAQAAAFVEKDPLTLIRIGLNMIPLGSHVARAIRDAVFAWENKVSYYDARERIATRFAALHPCNAVPNHAFTILGWLYGKDFGDKLLKAVNCGYDTDCTGATLGATLGILEGASNIPDKWRKPIGLDIVLHQFTRGFTPPKTVAELADRSIALAEKAAVKSEETAFGLKTSLPEDALSRLFRNEKACEALRQDNHCGIELAGQTEIAFHYHGEPVLRPGIAREVSISVSNRPQPEAELRTPAGWKCERLGPAKFRLLSTGPVAGRNQVTVRLKSGEEAEFTILGPDEAKGYSAFENVKKCPGCQARVEACICKEKK